MKLARVIYITAFTVITVAAVLVISCGEPDNGE